MIINKYRLQKTMGVFILNHMRYTMSYKCLHNNYMRMLAIFLRRQIVKSKLDFIRSYMPLYVLYGSNNKFYQTKQ
jgi:hypothetical protein